MPRKTLSLILSILIAGLLIGCSGAANQVATETEASNQTQHVEDLAHTEPAPTLTPTQTDTLRPTSTDTPTSTPIPSPTVTSRPDESQIDLTLEWLVTSEEINSFSEGIGVIQWELTDVSPGENGVCHQFHGVSWSLNPNEALNCIFTILPGTSFENAIDFMFESGRLFADEVLVESSLSFEGDFAVYAGRLENTGHSLYDLLLLKDNLLYWASVSLGTPVGVTSESLYESNREVIDTFLNNVIMINIERSK